MKKLSLVLAALLICSALGACGSPSQPPAQGGDSQSTGATTPATNYPGNKAINMVCVYGAGGGNDTTARLIAKYFPEYLGTMVVSNVSGNSGQVGSQQVMSSQPDGYTLVFNDANTDMLFAGGMTDYSMEVWESFLIPATADSASLQVSEWDTLEECIAWAKEHPGELTFGMETGSNTEMTACAFFQEFDIEGKLIDVGSTSNQIAALAGGHVKMIVAPVGMTKDYREAGQFNVLAFVLKDRHPNFPDIPTLIESGGPDWLYMPRYYYIGFPKGTDQSIIDKFSSALEQIVADERFIADMESVELTPNFMNPEQAQKYVDQTHEVWVKYAEAVNNFKGK